MPAPIKPGRQILPARKQRTRRLRSSGGGDDADNRLPCLPDEVVVGNILNRLPVKTLLRFNCVCKLWYASIHFDPNFASLHLNQSLKNPRLIFYVLNVEVNNGIAHTLFLLDDDDDPKTDQKKDHRNGHRKVEKKDINKDDDAGVGVDILFRKSISLRSKHKFEVVGFCNGLVCVSDSIYRSMGYIVIKNPSRSESLHISYSDDAKVICYGFGFDSLTNEYKVVLIVRILIKLEFKCLVFTLGGTNNKNSWRETSTRPPIGDLPPTADGIRTTMKKHFFHESAIFCGGALFWRTRSDNPTAANDNMLLSFDLHEEKFQAIPLPAECYSKSTEEQQHKQVVDPLMEFRGHPCVPHIEKKGGSCDRLRRYFDCKVHFHILVDKVEKVWIKETFDVHISSSSLHSPFSPCCCFYSTSTTRTRIFTSSDRVLLYWFNGEYLQFYNLHTKHLKVVKCSPDDEYRCIFKNKKYTIHPEENTSTGCCRINYHLNHHAENFFSLQTLIPRGAPELDYKGFVNFYEKKQERVKEFLFLQRKSSFYCTFIS